MVREDKAQAAEFGRRRSMARVDVRIISGHRDQSVYLHHHQWGEIGSMTKLYRRGKHVESLYVLPELPES